MAVSNRAPLSDIAELSGFAPEAAELLPAHAEI
jgi:hypothetical protein